MLRMIKQPLLKMLTMSTLHMLKLLIHTSHMLVSHTLIMHLNMEEFIDVLIVVGMAI